MLTVSIVSLLEYQGAFPESKSYMVPVPLMVNVSFDRDHCRLSPHIPDLAASVSSEVMINAEARAVTIMMIAISFIFIWITSFSEQPSDGAGLFEKDGAEAPVYAQTTSLRTLLEPSKECPARFLAVWVMPFPSASMKLTLNA